MRIITDTVTITPELDVDVAFTTLVGSIDLTVGTPTPTGDQPAWQTKARCADGNGTLTPLFFSDDVVDIARAKAICALCPLAERCLAEALENAEPWGVWGGQLIANGEIVATRRPRGRPPKVARPELVVDELGYPVCA
jgi:hypothetical protein